MTANLKIGDVLRPEDFGPVDESYIIRGRSKTVQVESRGSEWFAVQTNPKCETKAERGVREKCFAAYAPKSSDWRKRSKRAKHQKAPKVKIHRSLFTNYIFVQLPVYGHDNIPFGVVREIDGVRDFVKTSCGPLSADPAQIDRIREREAAGAYDATIKKGRVIAPRWAVPGTACQVTTGPFASFCAMIEECLPNDRVRVAVSIFGRETPVELELDQVIAI